MDDHTKDCVIISGYFETVAEANKYLYAALADYEETRADFEEMKTMYDLADMVEEPADIEIPRKIPRPPKRLTPVNKANYAANRPPKRARSSCYIRRH